MLVQLGLKKGRICCEILDAFLRPLANYHHQDWKTTWRLVKGHSSTFLGPNFFPFLSFLFFVFIVFIVNVFYFF